MSGRRGVSKVSTNGCRKLGGNAGTPRGAASSSGNRALALLLSVLFALSIGCTKQRPIVLIDDWWNVDYAKNACSSRASSNNPCGADPTAEVKDFEARLETAFAADPSCNGVVLQKLSGTEPHWQLMIDFNPGDSTQNWGMVAPSAGGNPSASSRYTTGRGDPKDTVHTVCALVKQIGGVVK